MHGLRVCSVLQFYFRLVDRMRGKNPIVYTQEGQMKLYGWNKHILKKNPFKPTDQEPCLELRN